MSATRSRPSDSARAAAVTFAAPRRYCRSRSRRHHSAAAPRSSLRCRTDRARHSRTRRDSGGAPSSCRRRASPRPRHRACPRAQSTNSARILRRRLRLIVRRHRADAQFVDAPSPRTPGSAVTLSGTPLVERQVGGQIRIVVAVGAVLIEHRPTILQRAFRRLMGQEQIRRGSRGSHDDRLRQRNPKSSLLTTLHGTGLNAALLQLAQQRGHFLRLRHARRNPSLRRP